ncbi:MAG: glycine cleavage system aminomethyltransferase GcvT [Alphaproteobacteria bacterium]|nr:glycine cleavage system aminomethyltransferase GcvT [Alphaproteobacteria bacterium]
MADPLDPNLSSTGLKTTPLLALHQERNARLVPFAGYAMPVQYPQGIIAEHLHTRAKAGLFDVSHMGQAFLWPAAEPSAAALERLVPGDLVGLAPGKMRYTLFTQDDGGILDDLMVTNLPDGGRQRLFLVVNAACKDQDFVHVASHLAGRARLETLHDRALLALQGPAAASALGRLAPGIERLGFLSGAMIPVAGVAAIVTRSGYTGEDGFEISVATANADRVARALLEQPEVLPIGLGARDSLRLEAGLCLYGHDIDRTTTPVAAGLAWAIGKARRPGGARAGGFPGAEKILGELAAPPARLRVGMKPDGKQPVREGAEIADKKGKAIGKVTSGGFGPTLGGPVAMGYVDAAHAKPGTALAATVRGKPVAMTVAPLPFVKPNYHRA